MDRFDLEQAITSLWNLSDDVNLVCETFGKEGCEDKILNSLIGISELNDMRVQRVMDIFEELLNNGLIKESHENYSDLTLQNDFCPEKVKYCEINVGQANCQKNSV